MYKKDKPRIGVLMRDAYGLTVKLNNVAPATNIYIRYSHYETTTGRSHWKLEYMFRYVFHQPTKVNPYDELNIGYLEAARQYLHAINGWHIELAR